MAAPSDDDMLREAARARGFRLVKSRRRKPGGDFGRYGLTALDSGRECLGFGADGLTANSEEVLAYLRGGEVASWKRSLIGVVGEGDKGSTKSPKPKTKNPARPERNRGAVVDPEPKKERNTPSPSAKARRGAKPTPARLVETKLAQSPAPPNSPPALSGGAGGGSSSPSASPERSRGARPATGSEAARTTPRPSTKAQRGAKPPPTIREATRRDAAALAKLLDVPAATLAERLAAAIRADEPPLVAVRDAPVGLIAWTITSSLQHGPRGRITLLVVAEGERRQGVGARLLGEAEQRLRDAGVAFVDLDLAIDFDAPVAFLRSTGYARTSNGYGKTAQPDQA